ncbi:MurR/RpiR family transcriptional regulator [Actinobacillus porcinus]|uniref:MurR/RpiR family transcriptional regulator n=1 Tax=Actinobacillus porcinus TaxID=51048 RepID=UPI002355A0A2|nr:MurR/RpiR family transcriptional regulator [Actinobacillus porcinus]MDY5849018.1 MurR/RpiR family transcriptional regulator [Actinobacillus porcinus]MDY6216196.1 MurR/RpiR family transcriptional regulator [Actinobacillus porcinus]
MMTQSNILERMTALQASLTKKEKYIAEQILQNPELLNSCSLADIAKNINVGEATIIRFCRSLGFKGFSDFKMEFAIELATQNPTVQTLLDTDIASDDEPDLVANKIQVALNKVVSETISLIDFNVLEQVVNELRLAKRIFLYGVGTSGLLALWGKNKFMRIGLQVDASSNNHLMYMQAALMRKGDVVIGLSHSGQSVETVQSLDIARKAGAKTIAITHNVRSPITKVADYVLHNGNRQYLLQGDSIGTQIAQSFVLDLIYTLLVQAEEEKAITAKQKTVHVILEQRQK